MNPHRSLGIVEHRLQELITDFLQVEHTADPPVESADVLAAVREQGVVSDAGGKRLRALLLLDAYDAWSGEHGGTGQRVEARPRVGTGQRTETANSTEAGMHTDRHTGGTPGHENALDRSVRDRSVLDLACAIEIYQTSALIHDDIIDESPVRRGKPSAHAALATAMGNQRRGLGAALMLGNMLATASADTAGRAFLQLPNTQAGCSAFLDMQRSVEVGQVLDLSLERLPLDADQDHAAAALQVYRWKTASYTTVAPLELGALAAGENPGRAHRLSQAIGLPLGIAFQLADDLLDVTGTSRHTGKPVGGDIREGKRTVLLADALHAATPDVRARLVTIFTNEHRDDRDVAEVTQIYERTGAIASSVRRIRALVEHSNQAITSSGLGSQAQTALTAACSRFIPDTAADEQTHHVD